MGVPELRAKAERVIEGLDRIAPSLACLNAERRELGLPLLTAPAPPAPTTQEVPV